MLVVFLSLVFFPLATTPAYAGEQMVLAEDSKISIVSLNGTNCEIDLELLGDSHLLIEQLLAIGQYWESSDAEIVASSNTELELQFTTQGSGCFYPGVQHSSIDANVLVFERADGWDILWYYFGGNYDLVFFYTEITVEPVQQTPISVDVNIPQQLSLNADGWYAENPTELRVNLTNNSNEALIGSLIVTFSDAGHLVFDLPDPETYIEAPGELTAFLGYLGAPGLDPGQSQELVWPLWVQPSSQQEIEFTARVVSDVTGEQVGEGTAQMSIPTAQIHPVVVIPGLSGSWKNSQGEWEIDPILGRYNNLLDQLRLAGYEDNISLYTFPYDWRKHISNLGTELGTAVASYLSTTTAVGKEYVDTSAVDIVSHSFGGLVSRAYIQGSSYQDNVHRLITLGTPHRGLPKAYPAAEGVEFLSEGVPIFNKIREKILHSLARKQGYCTDRIRFMGREAVCWPTDADIYRYVLERVPSIRELLPDNSYLQDDPGGYLVLYDDPTQVYPFGHQENTFLNTLNTDIDSLITRLGGDNIVAVVGDRISEDTDKYYRVVERSVADEPLWSNGKVEIREPGPGDKTVPEISADLGLVDNRVQVLTVNTGDNAAEIVHGHMPTQLQQSIVDLLTQSFPFFAADFSDLSTPNFLVIYNLSPVELQVTDAQGRRAGVDFSTGGELTEIPGAFFSRSPLPDEPDFLFIPEAVEGEYQVSLLGIAEGEYTVGLARLSEEGNFTIAEFSGTTSPDATHQHEVVYDSSVLPTGSLQLEWRSPLEVDSPYEVNRKATLPIKFSVHDAEGKYISDESVFVWVVDPQEPSEAIASFSVDGPGKHGKSDTIRIQEQQYIVNLHLKDYPFKASTTYKIGVGIFGQELGTSSFTITK